MDSRFLNKAGLCSLWILATLNSGCSDAVQLTQDTANGGIVTYLYKEDRGGPMGSRHRKQALQVIDQKCPGGYLVIRDGEVKGMSLISGLEGQDSEGTGRRWGIQFRCK